MHAKNSGWTAVGDGGDGLTRSEGWRYSLMGCVDREKGTTVGDGGDGLAKSTGWTAVGDGGNGLARSKGRRRGLCHVKTMNTGGRRQARSSTGPADIRRGTTVGNGGDGFAMSRGRRPGLRRAEMAAAPGCVQGKGRWTPDSGGSSDCRNHRSAIRQGQGGGGGGEKEGRVATVAFVLDVREV